MAPIGVTVNDSGWATSSSGLGTMGGLTLGSPTGINPNYLMLAVVLIAFLYFRKGSK